MAPRDSTILLLSLMASLLLHLALLWGLSAAGVFHMPGVLALLAPHALPQPPATDADPDLADPDRAGQGSRLEPDRPIFEPAWEDVLRGIRAPTNQPGLSRDPMGDFGQDPPTALPAPSAEAQAAASAALQPFVPPAPAPVLGLGAALPQGQPSHSPQPPPPVQPAPPAQPMEESPSQPALPATPPNNASADRAAGDPLPPSDSEVDPTSIEGTADISAGGIAARFGRKVRTVRPQLGVAGFVERGLSGSRQLRVELHVDPEGRVTDVRTLESTGLVELDLPVVRALYQWWIEPARDATGRPVPSISRWRINL